MAMKVLIACEQSGIVRSAFAAMGHDAWSCDILPADLPGQHITGDVLSVLENGWDLMIAHPPCTHLAVSGARWFGEKQAEQKAAIEFFMALIDAPIAHVCVENPVSIMSTRHRRPDQIIQPWQFGHGETKATCLWLKNLPLLVASDIVEGRDPRIHRMPPSKDRGRLRSLTYQGVADAMAQQWGRDSMGTHQIEMQLCGPQA